jgi:hypothetical protein
MPSRGRKALLLASLFASLVLLVTPPGDAADPPTTTVPDTVYPKLVEQSTEVIRTSLKGEVRPRAAARAATAAVVLAAFAQENLAGADGSRRVAVRDAALEIAERVRQKEYETAVKQLDGLAALKGDPNVKKEPIPLSAKVNYKDLMTQFRSPSFGGLGIEDRFDALGRSPDDTVPAKEITDVLLLDVYRTAVTAELMRTQKPKKGDAAEWSKLAGDMRRRALDLATAAQSKDGKAMYKAVNALNSTCDKCHQGYRKDE